MIRWLLPLLLLVPAAAQSQPVSPDVLVKSIAEEVIAEVRKDKALQGGDPARLAALVEAKIVPHFDFRRITQIAVGANWRKASPEQQEELARQFKTLLVRTYSGALAGYSGQTIEYRPLRISPGDTEVTVRSVIRQRGGAEPIPVEYDLANVSGEWKVFDVRISGISLVATYRTAFAEEVRNSGVDGLIQSLARKNRAS